MTNELVYISATTLAERIRKKQTSSYEATTAYLDHIKRVNPKLNAVVQLAEGAARARAREADDALARRETWGPLHGVPITIKDGWETEGIISTGGTSGRMSFVPARDATVVTRLRSAGAVILGKTNVPELSLTNETDNMVYGRTNDPYDLSRTPGGRSRGGTSSEGLPIGVQIISRPWCECIALAVAEYLESSLGGWQPPSL